MTIRRVLELLAIAAGLAVMAWIRRRSRPVRIGRGEGWTRPGRRR